MNLKAGARRAYEKGYGSEFLLMVNGSRELIFEDCRKILEYSPDRIVLEGKLSVEISGRSLKLKHLGNRNLSATGEIMQINIKTPGAR